MRTLAAVIGGLVVWFGVATLGNFVLRALLPGYTDVEPTMAFTADMQTARLGLGAVASLGAGWTTARIARGGRAVGALTIALVVLFIPVHYALWARFPVWYHVVFFASLVLVTLAGARFARPAAAAP